MQEWKRREVVFVVMEYDSDKINKDILRACPEGRSSFRGGDGTKM